MNLRDMTIEQLNARRAEIRSLAETEGADVNALLEEARAINAEIERRANEERNRAELRAAVAAGAVGTVIASRSAGCAAPAQRTLAEIRSSQEYNEAYLRALQTGRTDEVRALLTNQVEGGFVPVPTMLENEIKTSWEEYQLLKRVKHSFMKGKIGISFEYSATGAVIHVEGSEAPEEEKVELGYVEIANETIKKWITVSDESLEGTTVDTVGYIYKEIAQKIAEAAEEEIIDRIDSAPGTLSKNAFSVPVHKASTIDVDVVTLAVAELSAKAQNPVIILNRRTDAAFKSAAKKANYKVDPFDGIERIYTDKLPAFSAATTGDTYMMIGDLGYGFQANFPSGYSTQILKDPYTLAESDLVKLVGKMYVGLGLRADKAFVKVQK